MAEGKRRYPIESYLEVEFVPHVGRLAVDNERPYALIKHDTRYVYSPLSHELTALLE